MKYLALVLVALLPGCASINAAIVRICEAEDKAHFTYVSYVAPFRSTDKVLLEANNYAAIKTACLTGDPFQVVFSLAAAAKSLRK